MLIPSLGFQTSTHVSCAGQGRLCRSPRASGHGDTWRLSRSVSTVRRGRGTRQPAGSCRNGLGDASLPEGPRSVASRHRRLRTPLGYSQVLLTVGTCSFNPFSSCFAPDHNRLAQSQPLPPVGLGTVNTAPVGSEYCQTATKSPSQCTYIFYFFYDRLKISFASAKELFSQISM